MLPAGPEPWLPGPGVADAIAGVDFSWCALTATAAFPEDRLAPAQGFGIIEAGLPLLNTDAARVKPLSVGRPDDCALRLRDERGADVALVAEIVARDPSQPPTTAALVKYCRERLAGYKVPARFRVVVELPRTASGKLRR